MSITAKGAASILSRQARARALAELRYAPTPCAGRALCANLLERRPAELLDVYVHAILEATRGVGPEIADALQEAAGMHAAYTLDDLPHGKQCALVAMLRLRTVHGGTA